LSHSASSGFFETGCHYVSQVGHKLTIFLPQPPKFWDYRHVILCLANLALYQLIISGVCYSNTQLTNTDGCMSKSYTAAIFVLFANTIIEKVLQVYLHLSNLLTISLSGEAEVGMVLIYNCIFSVDLWI
jgi:hypothetical protein